MSIVVWLTGPNQKMHNVCARKRLSEETAKSKTCCATRMLIVVWLTGPNRKMHRRKVLFVQVNDLVKKQQQLKLAVQKGCW